MLLPTHPAISLSSFVHPWLFCSGAGGCLLISASAKVSSLLRLFISMARRCWKSLWLSGLSHGAVLCQRPGPLLGSLSLVNTNSNHESRIDRLALVSCLPFLDLHPLFIHPFFCHPLCRSLPSLVSVSAIPCVCHRLCRSLSSLVSVSAMPSLMSVFAIPYFSFCHPLCLSLPSLVSLSCHPLCLSLPSLFSVSVIPCVGLCHAISYVCLCHPLCLSLPSLMSFSAIPCVFLCHPL